MERLKFPKINSTNVKLDPRHFRTTRALLRNFVEKAYSIPKNVNIYSNGHRFYIFKGRWKRVKAAILQEWATAVSEHFVEWLEKRETYVLSLPRGSTIYARLQALYFDDKQQMEYFEKAKKRDLNFDAGAILKVVSSKNAAMRVRRRLVETPEAIDQ